MSEDRTISHPPLPDQTERDRFIRNIESNFGVVAPAGVGKTHSIVSRIATLAQESDAVEKLSTLVVVTYTNRAAQEMQRRARAAILAEAPSIEVLSAFNRAFFGTIHSFCLRLLQSYGHRIGVSGHAQLLEDDTELWSRFAQTLSAQSSLWQEPFVQTLLRHVPVPAIFDLTRQIDPRMPQIEVVGDCLEINPSAVFEFSTNHKQAAKKIAQDQESLRRWIGGWKAGSDFLPLLKPTSQSKPFCEVWNLAMEPLRDWLGHAALRVAIELSREYQNYRAAAGYLTFQDQISLAAELFSQKSAAQQIRRENYRIILDEAQDTDPAQFFVLFESAKDPDQPGDLPRPGHFAMVGDHQQSIYGRRADLATYQRIQRDLTAAGTGEEARFTVTFRCAERVVDFVNETFPKIFSGEDGQVEFVPLRAKPEAPMGQVVRWPVEVKPGDLQRDDNRKVSELERTRIEARQLAEYIRQTGLDGLRAREWGQVAILCPRKRWFAPLVSALKAAGLNCQLHSMREIAGDSPVYAWFAALLRVMTHPNDGYEIVGVLREIFGLSDHQLAEFAHGCEGVFQIERPMMENHPVAESLTMLSALRQSLTTLPLRDAVRKVVEETQLRERLKSLPLEMTLEEIDSELDDLLVGAAKAETEDLYLRDYSAQIEDGFYRERESDVTRRDAIQIMTCQKAKGLEWDAVIVPFFFRRIRAGNSHYPFCTHKPGTNETEIFLSADDADEDVKDRTKTIQRQELERLLYVTCTRARQTLLLADDRALFDDKADDYSATSFGNLLVRYEETNEKAWQALHDELHAEQGAKAAHKEAQGELLFSFGGETGEAIKFDLEGVKTLALDFPRRVTPHALATHPAPGEPEVRAERETDRPELDLPTPATIYGTWWHALMEALPWNDPLERWDEVFERLLPDSIDSERSRREWELFKHSTFAPMLNQPGWIFQAEMPFLWRANEKQIVEGVMDLAVFNPDKDEWLVIDWKTNRLGERGMTELVEIYHAQVEAYLKALNELFKKTVRGILYSTTLGQWAEVSLPKE